MADRTPRRPWFEIGPAPTTNQIDVDRTDRPCDGCVRTICPQACPYMPAQRIEQIVDDCALCGCLYHDGPCRGVADIRPGPAGPLEIHCDCPGYEPPEDEETN
ncbi:hypothetical protein SEA_MASK_76 [Mycobacterium phage Mask]|nr:hypothetical protein SEA_SEJANUS_75 [Mycobacterium phage Sejanus]UVT31609.1 hypothetical protein SEA_MASK_76 [Mycobacterium phage Mask]